jgi:DNA-binding FrmR family transcriptional regulator
MAHTRRDKKKLIDRLSRIRGQIDAIQRGLEQEDDCSRVLNTMAACRGAMSGLMAEVMEGHILTHVVDPKQEDRLEAAHELVEVIRSYMK